jgi:hypothetical protein
LNFADHSASSHKKRDVSEMGSVSVFSWRWYHEIAALLVP